MLKEIKNEIDKIDKSFSQDELAYLALTCKIELPLRDKLAFKLHKKLYSQDLIVSREWKRADIAIMKNEQPIAILEFKAMYTFDATEIKNHIDVYQKLMIEDLKKRKKLATNNTELYSILFATHPLQKIDKKMYGIVKYADRVNKAFEKHQTAEKILETCDNNIKNFFEKKKIKSIKGSIDAGECFNIKVKIPFWIIGPFYKNVE